jgi:hypothetical protein
MNGKYIVLLTLATGIVLVTSVAAAHPSATKQRVAITAKGTTYASPTGRFVLEPGAGALTAGASHRPLRPRVGAGAVWFTIQEPS